MGQNVLSQHNDLNRTGWNPAETQLTQATVSGGTFGKLFSRTVDDQIYTQPLIVNNVSVAGGTHNIVITATVNNTVYAFDAEDATKSSPYWTANLTFDPANNRPVSNGDVGQNCHPYHDFSGNIGIVGTPTIDPATNTIYVVARSVGRSTGTFYQYLHALNLSTGLDKISPAFINPTIAGNGDESDGTTVPFNQQTENQRPGLLFYNGVVYVSWASHCDTGPYHGWLVGYDASTLQQKYVYNTSANGNEAGIWMSGQAPAVDASGNIYVTTGNGTTGDGTDPNDPVNRGESLLKLSPKLALLDFFTPTDWDDLNAYDLDYGCDGVLLVPNTTYSLSGSKESWLYLINNNNMGKVTGTVPQMLDINVSYNGDKHVHGTPAYYLGDNNKEYIYACAEDGLLKQFPFNRANNQFDVTGVIIGDTKLPTGMPGAMLSVSSNAQAAGTGILWASHPLSGDANQNVVPGMLQAFDATDVTKELWNSNMNSARDGVGDFAKFVCPTVANGKVYLATFSNQLVVYGLTAPDNTVCPNTGLSPLWQSADIGVNVAAGSLCYEKPAYTVTASGTDIGGSADAFHSVFQPASGSTMTMTARVVSISNSQNPAAKAGVMFRSNLDPGSPNVFMGLTQGADAILQDRMSQNGGTSNQSTSAVASTYWVRLTGTGNQYTGYVSTDGTNWTKSGGVVVALGSTIYTGLAYSSANNTDAGMGTAVFDNVTFSSVSNPLPLTLLGFTASNVNNSLARLSWTTAQEVNFDHFEIERSISTSNFQPIGTVAGKGTTTANAVYAFSDTNPEDGTNYYRLKMIDKDGKVSYAPVVSVSFDLTVMQVYPNPARDHISVKTNPRFTLNGPVGFELVNMLGQRMPCTSDEAAGENVLTVHFPAGLAQGAYYLTATNGAGKKQSWKVQIRN